MNEDMDKYWTSESLIVTKVNLLYTALSVIGL